MNDSSTIFQRVTRDILDLFELQLELLSVDTQAARRKLTKAVVFVATAMALGGSALTVAMVGGGFLLAEWTGLSNGGAFLVVGGAAFLVVATLFIVALSNVRVAAAAMAETKSEFAENLRWLKATLLSPETSARNQLRSESFRNEGNATELRPLRSESATHEASHRFRSN